MKNVYEEVPVFEDSSFKLRFIQESDLQDFLEIYSDLNALPFFNSDNCHGDNFYYPDAAAMKKGMDFWFMSYKEKWFVRWAVEDKTTGKVIGSIELFHREADDYFNHIGLLRLDLGSAYEKAEIIEAVTKLILEPAYNLFDTDRIVTKIPVYAVERKSAFEKLEFTKSEEFLVGTMDCYSYKDYWEKRK